MHTTQFPNKDQQVAVGDAQGNLRVLEIPRNFTVPLNNEHGQMVAFYRKEHANMQFCSKRNQILKLQTMIDVMCEKKRNEVSFFALYNAEKLLPLKVVYNECFV